MTTLTTPLQRHIGRPSQCSKAEKKKRKAIHPGQEEIKLSLFANYDYLNRIFKRIYKAN